jgi:hypothetical protein
MKEFTPALTKISHKEILFQHNFKPKDLNVEKMSCNDAVQSPENHLADFKYNFY